MKNALLLSTIALMSFLGRSQCQADFTSSIANGTVDFTSTSTGSSLTYLWNFGDGFSSTAQNPSHTYTSVGSYAVCLAIYSNGGLCQDAFCDSVYVANVDSTGSACVTSFTVSSSSQSISCTNTSSVNSNFFYSYWDIYDATNTPVLSGGTTNITYFPPTSGTYLICLDAYDSLQNGCGKVCEYVYFNNDSLDSNLGYFLNKITFNVFPNPAQDLLTIRIDDGGEYKLMLTDLSGREISAVQTINGTTKMDIANFAPGIYVLNFSDSLGRIVASRKIIKE